jgi:hypothetical protein
LRSGATKFYAAADGTLSLVLADLTLRHRSREVRQFLELIDKQVPDDLAVDIVLEDVATLRTAEIQRWLPPIPASAFDSPQSTVAE